MKHRFFLLLLTLIINWECVNCDGIRHARFISFASSFIFRQHSSIYLSWREGGNKTETNGGRKRTGAGNREENI